MRQGLLFRKSYGLLKKWQRGKNTSKHGNFGFVFGVQFNLFMSWDKTKELRLHPLMKKIPYFTQNRLCWRVISRGYKKM